MTALVSRFVGLLYEAPEVESARATEAVVAVVAPAVAVLAAPAAAAFAGGAVALGLVGRAEAASALVCEWPGARDLSVRWRAPATPATRELAARIAARGCEVQGSGRLAFVRLPELEQEAVAQAGRAAAAAGGVPTVLVLGGARGPAFDERLAHQDLVIVATREPRSAPLARLALEGLEGADRPAVIWETSGGPLARLLASAGIALGRSLRASVAQALEPLP